MGAADGERARSAAAGRRSPGEIAALRERVGRIAWWHTIDLGDGIVTPGTGQSEWRLAHMGLPDDLTGRTVLDLGTWDGLFAFEAKRRGAAHVVALDDWQHPGFAVAREALGLDVEFVRMDVREMTAEAPGVFDLVLFMGILYHVPDPLAALRRVFEVTGERVILETDTSLHHLAAPAAELRAGPDSYENTAQNWWIPNPSAVLSMLSAVGFQRSEIAVGPRPPSGWLDRLPLRARRTKRLIVHAWR